MKQFFRLCAVVFIYSSFQYSYAATINIKSPAFTGEMTADSVKITDTQMTLSCRFTKDQNPGQLERIMYPLTHHELVANERYSLRVKAARYWEFLPTFDIKNCSLKLIVIAKDKNQRSHLGDFVLLGSEKEQMTQEEIQEMKSELEDISRMFQPFHIFLERTSQGLRLAFRK